MHARANSIESIPSFCRGDAFIRADIKRDAHTHDSPRFLSPRDEDLRRGNDVPSWNLPFYDTASFEFRDASLVLSSQIRGGTACRRTKGKRTTNQEHDRLARRAAETRIFIRDDRTIRVGSHATFLPPDRMRYELTRRS